MTNYYIIKELFKFFLLVNETEDLSFESQYYDEYFPDDEKENRKLISTYLPDLRITAIVHECRFWNIKAEQWSTDGCTVSSWDLMLK